MNWQERAEKAEAEVASLRWQEPVATLLLSYDGADFEMYYDNNKLRFEGMSMKLYAAAGAAPAALEMLRAILNTADAKRIFDALSGGKGIGTDDGRTWLAARAMLQSAPEAPENFRAAAVAYLESIDRFNTLNSTVGGGWSTKKAGTHQEIVLAANEMHGRRMLLESLLQSTPQSSSEPVAHHPV